MRSQTLQESISYLEQAARLFPGNRRYLVLLGEAYLLNGDTDGALAPLMAGFHGSNPPRASYLLALTLLAQGRPDEAVTYATRAVDVSNAFHRALYVRARAYFGVARYKEALEDMTAAVSMAPERAEYRLARIRILIGIGYALPHEGASHFRAALEALEEAPPSPRASGERAFLRGLAHTGLGNDDRALDFLDTTSFPAREETLLRRGICHLRQGRPVPALDALRRLREPRFRDAVEPLIAALQRGDPIPPDEIRIPIPDEASLWPDPCDPSLELLQDAQDVLHLRMRPAASHPPSKTEARTIESPEIHATNNRRIREIVYNLERGRALLLEGKQKKALRLLDIAWEMAVHPELDLTEAGQKMRNSVAESLMVAYRSAKDDAAIIARGEEFFRAGFADPRFLETLSAEFVAKKRADELALSVHVALVEAGGPRDKALRSKVLRILALAYHVSIIDDVKTLADRVAPLQRLHRAVPNLAFPRLYLGRYYYLESDFALAARYFDGIRGHLANSAKLLTLRARCAEKVRDVDVALELYQRALEKNFHQPHVHFRIGRILLERYVNSAG